MTTAGRPKKIKFDKTKIKPPILITVYKLTYPGHEQVMQYYKYVFTLGDSETSPYIDSCPGCGRELKYGHLEHKCPGTLLPNPVDATARRLMLTKAEQDRRLKQYVGNLDHPIQLTE